MTCVACRRMPARPQGIYCSDCRQARQRAYNKRRRIAKARRLAVAAAQHAGLAVGVAGGIAIAGAWRLT